MRLKAIIAISGRICSGKSYAANLIARQLNIPVASSVSTAGVTVAQQRCALACGTTEDG